MASYRFQGNRELLTIETVKPLAEGLAVAVTQNAPLVEISFSGKSIGMEAAQVLVPVLEKLPQETVRIDFSDIISGDNLVL